MLEQICRETIGLPEEEIAILRGIAATMQYMADLSGSNVFIDCFYEDRTRCIVAAEAMPSGVLSVYERCVVGEDALAENEPAVFAARTTGLPVRDLRATTQENKKVRQDVVPIKNKNGIVFAVLIKEKDVSEQLRQEKKYREYANVVERLSEKLAKYEDQERIADTPAEADRKFALKETHHRIKNNLQMVASILNMQARRSSSEEMKNAFKENVSRILSFAAIHEILTSEGLGDRLPIMELMEKLRHNTTVYSNSEEQLVEIRIKGEDFLIPFDDAASIALVVNELLANAVEHAFVGRDRGNIVIDLKRGSRYSTITISDDGTGFDFESSKDKNLGLSIVNLTVNDKLGGRLRIFSDEGGSRVQFDFRNETRYAEI